LLLWGKKIARTVENYQQTSMEVDFSGVKSCGCHMLQKGNAQTFLRKAKFYTEKKRHENQVAENSKFSGFHSLFLSRNDCLMKILSQYRCR
jgi:hypothetical protein